jgi:23S rRNA (guanosine2251-2'-O)-methyltransferase
MPFEKAGERELVEGRNPVLEALRGPRKVYAVYIAEGVERKGPIAEILSRCQKENIIVSEMQRDRLDELAETTAPQGVIAEVSTYRYANLEELLKKDGERAPLVMALDGVEDPRNFGSLLRVADATGADGVVVARRRSAHVTATVAKASAGAVEHVRIAQVANIAATIERLKEQGFWVVGADSERGQPYYEIDMTGPTMLVLGGEGKGLGRLVGEKCDFIARLPMLGSVSSLNVATAGAVLAYEAVRQRALKEGPA